MTRCDYKTSLTLDRYAKLMGINPISFSGAVLSGIDTPLVPPGNSCSGVWFQRAWQNHDQVSREDLGREIQTAESELQNFLGYYFSPTWITGERHEFDDDSIVRFYGMNSRQQRIRVENSYVDDVGQMVRTVISNPKESDNTLVYSDSDGDTFEDLATLTVDITGITIGEYKNVKVFYHDMSGDDTYEIRYPKKITLVGNIMTIKIDSYLMLDYGLWDDYPNSQGELAIDITNNDKFVSSVDVCLEKVDITKPSVKYYWEIDGEIISQDGWMNINSGIHREYITPYPAYYDAGKWYKTSYLYSSPPSYFDLYYRSGKMDREYFTNKISEPLSNDNAQIIMWLATARLDREFCQCGNATHFADSLREDLSKSGQGQNTYFLPINKIENPFGTRRGEIMAWQRVAKYGLKNKSTGGTAV